MPFDEFVNIETLHEERRKHILESLRSISIEELRKIAKEHEDEFVGDPWREEFLRLMADHPHSSFYHAVPQQNIEVFYCHDHDFGFWVIPGSGSGPLTEQNKRQMTQALELFRSGAKIGAKT